MNAAAFKRSEAIQKLEHYAPIIIEHLALLKWFPNHAANNHWQIEIAAFTKTLHRVSKPKGKRNNLNADLVLDALNDALDSQVDRDLFLVGVEGHGVEIQGEPDWEGLKEEFKKFASKF